MNIYARNDIIATPTHTRILKDIAENLNFIGDISTPNMHTNTEVNHLLQQITDSTFKLCDYTDPNHVDAGGTSLHP